MDEKYRVKYVFCPEKYGKFKGKIDDRHSLEANNRLIFR
jgi:hypothetical protein